MIKRVLLTVFSMLLVSATGYCSGVSGILESSLKNAVGSLSDKLSGRICIFDFVESKDNAYSSELGEILSNMTTDLLLKRKNKKFQVVARREVVEIMQDSTVFGDDSNTIERLTKEAKMDMLVSGSYAAGETETIVNMKVVNARDGQVVASVSCRLENTPDIEKMMRHRYKRSNNPDGTHENTEPAAQDALEIESGVFYEGGNGKLYPMKDGMVLSSKDNYTIYFKPKTQCYVYIYQVDSSLKAVRIFPNSNFSSANNPLSSNTENWLPDKNEYLYLDENPGTEQIYIFATHAPAPELENIKEATFSEIQTSIKTMGIGGRRGSDVVRKVKGTQGNPMELISRKLSSKGDFFYSISFIHK